MTEELPEIFLENREDLTNYLKATDYEYVILKFTANWCNPCKRIKPLVDTWFQKLPSNFIIVELDIDDTVDLYFALRSKKMLNGIPVILVEFFSYRAY